MSLPRTVRKFIFWLHLAAGLTAGLVILLLAVTGLLISFERQILAWQDGYTLSPPVSQAPLSLEALTAKVVAASPGVPLTGISRERGAHQPFAFSFGKEKQIFADPHTGAILGEGSPRLRGFFIFVTGLHRWLALPTAQRDIGTTITGATALFFFFLVMTGLYMWWPRRWTWTHVRRIIFFQSRLHGPARDWNWHNVLGFWCALPVIIITLSGAVIAFEWANNLLFRIAGSPVPPPKAAAPMGGAPKAATPAPALSFAGLDRTWALAEGKVAAWQSISARLPAKSSDPITFTISISHRGRPDLKSQLTADLATGQEKSFETFDTFSRGKQWRQWARWLHTGEAGGFLGQVIAALSSLSAILLVWTGFSLALRRFKRR